MKDTRPIIFIIVAAVLLKFLFLFFVRDIRLWEDHTIALNLLKYGEQFYNSDGAKYFTFQFPVYPFLVACIYKVLGIVPHAVAVFNILLNGFTAFALFLFMRDFINYFRSDALALKNEQWVCWVVVLIFLLHPGINYYALYNVHPFSIDLFFLTLALWRLMLYANSPVTGNLVWLGLAWGFALLDRASLAIALFPLFILQKQSRFSQGVRPFIVIGLISLLVSGPWLMRNYYKDGIIGFEASIGKNLWKGSMPEGEGSNYLKDGDNYYSALIPEEKTGLYKMTPKEQHDFFVGKYLTYLKNDPMHVVKLYVVKLGNFWWFRQSMGNEYPPSMQNLIPLYKSFYACVLLLSLLSLFLVKGARILFFVPLILSLLQAVFYVETRHRMIIEPLLIFLALMAIAELYQRYGKKAVLEN